MSSMPTASAGNISTAPMARCSRSAAPGKSRTHENERRHMQLGPELFQLLNSKQWVGSKAPVVYGVPGLSSAQIASIEAELRFRLPDDFVYLFGNLRDPGGVLFPWLDFDKRAYDEKIEWGFAGSAVGVEWNHLWTQA